VAIVFHSLIALLILLKFLNFENVGIFLSNIGAVQPCVAKVNAKSGNEAQSHSGIYSQNCNAYFLIVLLLGLSSVSINLPTLTSASRNAADGAFHHHSSCGALSNVLTVFTVALQNICPSSLSLYHKSC
jgi:hypothetical protein